MWPERWWKGRLCSTIKAATLISAFFIWSEWQSWVSIWERSCFWNGQHTFLVFLGTSVLLELWKPCHQFFATRFIKSFVRINLPRSVVLLLVGFLCPFRLWGSIYLLGHYLHYLTFSYIAHSRAISRSLTGMNQNHRLGLTWSHDKSHGQFCFGHAQSISEGGWGLGRRLVCWNLELGMRHQKTL